MSKMIVTGIDGNFGGNVVKTIVGLVEKENLILTAPTKEGIKPFLEQGFDARTANFNHRAELEQAFEGGDVILIISAPFVGHKRQTAHKNAIDAAKSAGVKKVVYTSLVNARDPENPSIEKIDHAVTEEYIESTGMDYIFLRNSQYAEAMITSYMTSNGVMTSCQGDGKMAYISRADCAVAAAYALIAKNIHKTALNINGPEALTLSEFVAIGNLETGRNVTINNVTEEETYAAFDAIGVPRNTDGQFQSDSPAPYSSDGMVTFARAIRLGKMNTFTDDFEKLTGCTARTVSHMFANVSNYQVGRRNSTDL